MSRFQVITAELAAASAVVSSSGDSVSGAQTGVSLSGGGLLVSGGALGGTPVAGAYDALVMSVDSALANMSQASGECSTALIQAASAYQMSDQSAAGSLSVKGG